MLKNPPVLLTKEKIKSRLMQIKQDMNDYHDFWKKLVLTEGMKVQLFGSCVYPYTWRGISEKKKEKNIIQTVKHGG